MKILSLQETLRHLKDLAANAPRLFEKPTEAAAFASHCTQLVRLLDEHRSAELPVSVIRDALFPNATCESARVLFANFRKTLSATAGRDGRDFSLVQPDLRGRDTSTVSCHFTGSSVSLQPDMDDIARRAVAGRDNETLIQAPAAFVTGEFYERLLLHFNDPQTSARLPVRFFLSYAHKNSKLKDKLLDALRDELAISRRFDFSIWEDKGILVGNEWHREIQTALAECDLCLSLLSPAYLASNYIVEHEIPPIVAREIPAIPVELEPLDLKRHNTRGLEDLQIFTPAFSKCTGNSSQKEFARILAHKIEEKVAEEALAIAQRFAADYLSGKRGARDLVGHHPGLLEILSDGESGPAVSITNTPPASESPAKLRINSLLTGCLKSLPSNLITPYAATGDLESVTREIARQSANDDAPDPYLIFQRHQRSAVDYLAVWAQNPDGAPFAAVLGEIGSGKTTTLQMLAQRLAKEPAAPPIIFIDLREYFDPAPPTLEGILADHLRRYDPEKKLTVNELIDTIRTHRGVIVFDGLDEKIISLSEAARQNFIRELWRVLPPEFMDKPAESGRGKLIISCRSHYFPNVQAMGSGYVANDRSKVKARDYLACVMLPWKDEQIREYLLELFGKERVETALDLIATVHNLKDLASRPYLISLIGPELEELEKDRAAGLTVNAASLYRKFIERWLHRDDGKHVFTPAHKLRLMENLAAALWRENARTWPWERVEEWLETFLHEHPVITSALAGQPISVLQQDFRTATFFLRPDACAESFRFAHTSLQEYFLACHLARALEKSDFAAWNLPEPSRETFDFLGQHLLTLPAASINEALSGLASLLEGATHLAKETPPTHARRNALRYTLRAHRKELPASDSPALDCRGLDLEGWEFHGTERQPLIFRETTFASSNLLRASFEHVRFFHTADFRAADLRSSRFVDCYLTNADLRDSHLQGAFFRECDLNGIHLDAHALKANVIAHLCPGNPWPHSIPPSHITASFAHGHSHTVTSARFSPDGRFIVSAAGDHTVRIWDTVSGKLIRLLIGHSSWVASAAFSPDGRYILSASWDKTLRIWETASGKSIRTISANSNWGNFAAFSNDGTMIVFPSTGDTLGIWDATSGNLVRALAGHSDSVNSGAFSPDGRFIASASWDKTIRIWELASGHLITTLIGHSASVTCATFSPKVNLIASASEDHTLRIWDLTTGLPVRLLAGHLKGVTSAEFSPEGNLIVSASEDNTLCIWEVSSGLPIRKLRGHSNKVNSAAFSADGNLIVSTSEDNTIRVWDVATGKLIRSINGHSTFITGPTVSPSRNFSKQDMDAIIGNSIHQSVTGTRMNSEALSLPRGQWIVREPWDQEEARKPYHEIRWKFVYGPKDAWRWCHVVDPKTGAIHPPELAAVPGAFSGPEVGPV